MDEKAARIIAQALRDCFVGRDERNIVDAIDSVAYELKYLGNGNASTTMGAIEGFAMLVRDNLSSIADALHTIAGNMPITDDIRETSDA
jgi:hypothetical protein